MTIREEKLLQYLFSSADEMLDETLLETCADQEVRICKLELGID